MALRYFATQALVRDFGRLALSARAASTTAATQADAAPAAPAKKSALDEWGTVYYGTRKWEPMPKDFKEFPERDTANFPHPELPLWPSKVRMGVFPDSWFQALYNKTGGSGPYVLGGGFMTFLLSKEWLVLEHEWMHMPPIILLLWLSHRLLGHKLSQFGDKLVHDQMDKEEAWRDEAQGNLQHVIKEEQGHQEALKATAPLLAAVKKENLGLQLESEYRSRLQSVHDDVKRRLDYMLETETAKRRFAHQHMVDWVGQEVSASITPEKEKAFLQQCIGDLQALAKKNVAA